MGYINSEIKRNAVIEKNIMNNSWCTLKNHLIKDRIGRNSIKYKNEPIMDQIKQKNTVRKNQKNKKLEFKVLELNCK